MARLFTILLFLASSVWLNKMSRKPANHVKIMFCLSPALAKAFRRVAAERKQTNSTVAEEFLQDGVTTHDARKVPAATSKEEEQGMS